MLPAKPKLRKIKQRDGAEDVKAKAIRAKASPSPDKKTEKGDKK